MLAGKTGDRIGRYPSTCKRALCPDEPYFAAANFELQQRLPVLVGSLAGCSEASQHPALCDVIKAYDPPLLRLGVLCRALWLAPPKTFVIQSCDIWVVRFAGGNVAVGEGKLCVEEREGGKGEQRSGSSSN